MTVRMHNLKKKPYTHEGSNSQFNEAQIMQFIVTYATGMYP